MTITATGGRPLPSAGDIPIDAWPATDRAEFLQELAHQVSIERSCTVQSYTRAAKALIPVMASALCADPASVFDELVEAAAALTGFEQHPRWDTEADAERVKVDRLVAQLLGAAS